MKTIFKIYRLLLAPLWVALGGGCRFYPSCSHYAEQAIERYGYRHGALLTLRRLGRCHPQHPGGIDELAQTVNSRYE